MRKKRIVACVLVCVSMSGVQAAEQAGDTLRELENQPLSPPPEPPSGTPTLQLPQADAPADGQATVTLDTFHFSGNTAFSDSELAGELAGLRGQALTLAQLQAAADRVTTFYRQHGWLLARAVLPPQDITDGALRIRVLEGRYGQVRVNNDSRVPDAVTQRAIRGLKHADGIRTGPLENALMSLDALPGTRVGSRLSAGDEVGTSNLDMTLNDSPSLNGNLAVDNYRGTDSAAYRLGLGAANPFGLGDALEAQALWSNEGQTYVRGQYDLPLGPWNTRVGIALSWLEYRLGADFEDLDAKGKATTASLFAAQNWWHQRRWGLSSRLAFQHRDLEDEQLGLVSEKSINSLVFDLINGYWRDDLLGGGANSYRLSWTHGQLSLDSPYAQAADVYDTEGSYNKYGLALLRQQRLAPRLALRLSLRGQLADGNLDSVEKISLGGAYGIRAFPQGEASGDEGWLVSAELRHTLTSQWQLGAFVEAGGITYNRNPLPLGDEHRNLKGAGVSAYWQPYRQWQVTASAATALDDEEPISDDPEDVYVWARVQRQF